MHFLISTFGSAGDVFPLIGLSLALRERGHDITFATNDHFAGLVEQNGLRFERLGSEEAFQASLRSPDLWHPNRAFRHVFSFLSPVLRQQYELHTAFAGQGNVAAITNCFGFGALLAQETHRLPVITVHLQPAVLWSRFAPPTLPGLFGPAWLKSGLYAIGERFVIDRTVCPFLNPWRGELGLPPVRKITRWWNSPFGVLCLFPDWFAPPQLDWPQPLMQTDFPLWNHRDDESLDGPLEEFLAAGGPPIVFTPGSANLHGAEFFRAAVEACNRLERRGLLLTKFPEQVPADLPGSVRHASYVPLDDLLPRSAAFVHHGGVGSTSQAMLAGIPQVVIPLAHDQFDNAARIARLRVGGSLPSRGVSGERLSRVLAPLLNSREVAETCRTLSQRLAARDGLSRAAVCVEQRMEAAARVDQANSGVRGRPSASR